MYGKEINERIKELNISQQEIASFVEVSNTEIKCIRNDERQSIKKATFLKLMKYLDLNPYDFGGFAKLDFANNDDFIEEIDFITYLKDKMKKNKKLTARSISEKAGISEAQMSRILSRKKTEISIDCFARICNYIGVDYQYFLKDKNIVPSFYSKEKSQETKTEILKNYISRLTIYDQDRLLEYANFLLTAPVSDKEKVNKILKIMTRSE